MRIFKFLGRVIFICSVSTALLACGGSDVAAPNGATKPQASAHEKPNDAFKTPGADIAAINAMSTLELLEAAAYESHKLADVLAQVNDAESAYAAAAEMHTLEPMLNAVGQRLESLDGNDMMLSTGIFKPMQAFAKAQARIFNEAGRIATSHPELQGIVAQGLENIDSNFQ